MAFNPYQKYPGFLGDLQGGGAGGETGRLLPMERTPASMFEGFRIPSGSGAAVAVPPRPGALTGSTLTGPTWTPGGRLGEMVRGGPAGGAPQHPLYTPLDLGLRILSAAASGNWPEDGVGGGVFGPGSIEAIIRLLRGQAMDVAGAGQNRAALAAEIYGAGDPSRAGYASLQSALMGQSDTARLLGQGELQQTQSLQDFYRQLLMTILGGAYSRYASEAQGQSDQFPISLSLPGISLGG